MVRELAMDAEWSNILDSHPALIHNHQCTQARMIRVPSATSGQALRDWSTWQ
jgi:hypothetical protein